MVRTAGGHAGYAAKQIARAAAYETAKYAYDRSKQAARNYMQKNVDKMFQSIPRPKGNPKKPSVKRKATAGAVSRGSRYHTKGRAGPRFPRVKKTKSLAKYQRYGSTFHEEDGGTRTASIGNTMYIGHGFGISKVWGGITRAIVKNLFEDASLPFTNWEDIFKPDALWGSTSGGSLIWTISLDYKINQELNTSTGRTSFNFDINTAVDNPSNATFGYVYGGTNWTYFTIADTFATFLRDTITTSSVAEYQLQKVRLFFSAATVQMGMLNLQDSTLSFDLKSRLKLQNRTLAGGGATNADLTTDVAANPLNGRIYEVSKSHFELNNSPNTQASATTTLLSVPADSSIIYADSSTLPLMLRKPPHPSVFKCSKTVNVIMAPGDIRTHYINYQKTMSLNAFITKYSKALWNWDALVPTKWMFGKSAMLGLETMMNSRGDEATEISLSYEKEQDFNISFAAKNQYPPGIIRII